jgi:mono/diheme cytochrome c family protein
MKAMLTAAVLAFSMPALADAPSGDAARGKALFRKNMCYTCHGSAGQGGDRGSGPRIAYDVWPWEGFVQQVRHPREQMPRYTKEHVSDQELADIYAYVSSFKKGPKAADIQLLRD